MNTVHHVYASTTPDKGSLWATKEGSTVLLCYSNLRDEYFAIELATGKVAVPPANSVDQATLGLIFLGHSATIKIEIT